GDDGTVTSASDSQMRQKLPQRKKRTSQMARLRTARIWANSAGGILVTKRVLVQNKAIEDGRQTSAAQTSAALDKRIGVSVECAKMGGQRTRTDQVSRRGHCDDGLDSGANRCRRVDRPAGVRNGQAGPLLREEGRRK